MKNHHDFTELVRCEGNPDLHPNLYKTLVLLRLFTRDGEPVYFVVEGLADVRDDDALSNPYYYDVHSCPTNYVPVEAIMTPDDPDPHGIFEFVVARWMPKAYLDTECNEEEEFILNLFPEITNGAAEKADPAPINISRNPFWTKPN